MRSRADRADRATPRPRHRRASALPCAPAATRRPTELPAPIEPPARHFLHGHFLSVTSSMVEVWERQDILSLIAKLVLRGVEQIFVGGVAWETTEGCSGQRKLVP
ncbi:uncharacterized protein [Zea mays]|uniref:uncharacterized protein isoform X3 n=1 Tax=Zea mays TaxID=4577 RepID=UPI001652B265|nr:uncharacterized protein LOC111589336 isoform X3 [Zea mays]